MLSWFKRRAQDRRTAVDLYGVIVAQARQPEFFGHDGVLDTPEGRTSMIILLMFPLLERLHSAKRGRRVARLLSEIFVTDIDDCLREMGVGDMSVPKKVKRAAQALGERCNLYRNAANGPDPVSALVTELAETVPGLSAEAPVSTSLARYILEIRGIVAAAPTADLLEGRFAYPAPAAPVVPTAKR